jgi:hypothetical protein
MRWKIKVFLLGKHCTATDKDKACEHEKKKTLVPKTKSNI